MAYSAEEKAAAQGAQDWLNAGNQWMVDIMGWDWFFQTNPQFAPYRDAVMNRSAVLSEPAAPPPTQTQTQTPSNADPNVGKVYERIQDIPEGYDWTPTAGIGKPLTSKEDIMAQLEAAARGESTDYQKQFTYQVTGKKPEGVLTQQAPGLYTFVKDGKEYVYSPKDFVKYGAVGQENVQSTGPNGESLDLGRSLTVNPLLKSKDLLDKATKTNIDPKQYQVDFSKSGVTDPYQGYVWRKQDYVDTISSLTGGKPTDYNYNPNDIIGKGAIGFYPDQYGSYQGQDENGNYIYRQGRSTTTFDPRTGAGRTYTPGDSGFGDLLPILGIIGLAFGAPFLGELGAAAAAGDVAAGEVIGATLAEAGFGELTAAELASLGYDASWAETLGALPGFEEGFSGMQGLDGYEPPTGWETADTTPIQTPDIPDTTPPNLEGGDLGNNPPNLEGGDLGNTPPNLEGGDLGQTEAQWQDQFYRDIGIDPSSLSDLPPATMEEINQILQSGPNVNLQDLNRARQAVNLAKATMGGGTKIPTKPPIGTGTGTGTGTIPGLPTGTGTAGGAAAGTSGLDLGSLIALLGAAGGSEAATPPQLVDIGSQLDLESPLQTNPFARSQTQSKMAEGGSIDDLLELLQQRG